MDTLFTIVAISTLFIACVAEVILVLILFKIYKEKKDENFS